jgi:transcription antitermination factor NusG
MTLDGPAIRAHTPPQHDTGRSIDALPMSCRRIRWYCAWTEHHRERIAENAIRAAGFESYLPLYLQHRSHSQSIVPCFPRYVLCRFDAARDAWGKIIAARGVSGLICHAPGRPTPLPDYAITLLLARTSARGIVDDPGDGPPQPLGAGYKPVWEPMGAMDEGTRVRLLVRLFGASVARQTQEDE